MIVKNKLYIHPQSVLAYIKLEVILKGMAYWRATPAFSISPFLLISCCIYLISFDYDCERDVTDFRHSDSD
jgi:hypothetical protein